MSSWWTCDDCGEEWYGSGHNPCPNPRPKKPEGKPVVNLMEGVARETVRVAKIRHYYAEIGPAGGYALSRIDQALENACKFMGEGDIVKLANILNTLKGFKE